MKTALPEPALAAGKQNLLIPVLSEIARAVAGSLELREVFALVADAARRVLPFDGMGVVRIQESGGILLHAVATGIGEDESGESIERGEISPGIWPERPAVRRICDAERELDPSFALDRKVLAHGTRSILSGPLMRGEAVMGGVWFASCVPNAFHEEDELVLGPIADLLALALQHEELSRAERERRRRREVLEKLVPALSKALDIRDVFNQVSAIAQEVLPHDRMAIGLLREDRKAVRIYALSGEPVPGLPEEIPLTEGELPGSDFEFEIVRDIRTDGDLTSPKCQILLNEGIRSSLRVPIHLEGQLGGGLVFHSKSVGTYRESDVDIARRIADQVALVLSHQRLAEEARRVAEARAEAARLETRVARLTEELESRDGFHRIVGKAKSWRDVLVQATKVALTETTVLLTGESGTGKEVIARAIHRASPRANGPFSALNCAALPDQLLESELFGYEKGAFTGASGSKPGRLEQAAGGVLFLDEAGEMSPVVQAKLLRVLEEREFQRLGATKALKADVRVIAATNRDLKAAIQRGGFREDLYYRLHVFEIRLPPLRERQDDILALTEAFLDEIGREMGRPAAGISREAKELLLAHSWPGNVRELRNALERAAILCDGGLITGAHLPISVARGDGTPAVSSAPEHTDLPAGGVDLEAVERSYIVRALRQAGSNKSRAAKLLGLTRAQLYSRIEKYALGGDRS